MLRSILAVVGSYIVMFIAIALFFTAMFFILGPDRSYQPGTYDVSTMWIGVWAVGSIFASIIGGFVCAKIAKAGSKAHLGLVGAVVVLGLMSAMFLPTRPDPGPRVADEPVWESANKAVQPRWTNWANIPIGAIGVLLGAQLGRKKEQFGSE